MTTQQALDLIASTLRGRTVSGDRLRADCARWGLKGQAYTDALQLAFRLELVVSSDNGETWSLSRSRMF